MSREYRGITRDLPPDAFHADPEFDQRLTDLQRNAMFRYFDLSSEGLWIAATGKRVSTDTAAAWRGGIKDNSSMQRFARAWNGLEARLPNPRDDDFTWLRPRR